MVPNINSLVLGGFVRLQNFPLDSSFLYETKNDMDAYLLTEGIAYSGQLLAVINDGDNNGIYYAKNNNGLQAVKLADKESVQELSEAYIEITNRLTEFNTRLLTTENAVDSISAENDELQVQVTLVNNRIDELLGAAYSDLSETMNTIKEIHDWILNHQEEFNSLISLSDDVASTISRVAALESLVSSIVETVNGTVTFEFGTNKINKVSVPLNSIITKIIITIKTKATTDLTTSVSFENNDTDIIDVSLIDFSETIPTGSSNSYVFDNLNYSIDNVEDINFYCNDFKNASGEVYINYQYFGEKGE